MTILSDFVTVIQRHDITKVENITITQKELTATRTSHRLPVSHHSENIQRINESRRKDSWEPHAALRAAVENHCSIACAVFDREIVELLLSFMLSSNHLANEGHS